MTRNKRSKPAAKKAGEEFKHGGGVVPIAVLAAENGQTVAQAKRSLADLSAAGVVRLVIGGHGDVARTGITQYLKLLDEDGSRGCLMMFLKQPAPALAASARLRLDEMLAQEPGLPLGSVAMLCASARLADSTGFVASDPLEDYLGARRGSLASGNDEDDGWRVDT
jgi:hypothetical protein